MVGTVFALVVAIAGGPPALPPLPGEEPPPEDEPLRPEPKPKAAPAKPKAAPAKPKATPEPAPTSEPEPAPTPEPEQPPPPDDSAWSVPQLDAPPQPDGGTTPPTDTLLPPESKEPAPPLEAPELPGDDAQPQTFRLPPPERPFYGGTGLMIGAGVTFAVALSEQIVAHILVKRRCIDPIGAGAIEDTADFGQIFTQCAPGVLPALALRVHSDLGLLATIGLAAGGGALRGQRDAWDDVFRTPKTRKVGGFRIGGIALIGTGIVTWFSTGAAAWGVLGKCRTARCANAARAMAFSTRHVSAVLVAAGAGMLAYAEAHRRHTSRYQRDKLMTVQPVVGFGVTGLAVSGSF